MKWIKILLLTSLLGGNASDALDNRSSADRQTNLLEIQTYIDDRLVSSNSEWGVNIGPFPSHVHFDFGPFPNSQYVPVRFRYKLDGYDNHWNQEGGEMSLTVRFYNDTGDQIGQEIYIVNGDSSGWNGSLKTSPLTHRRETLVVPPHASRLWIVISSAQGGPATVGIYVVDNLVVSSVNSNNSPRILLQSPLDSEPNDYSNDRLPQGWIRDGLDPSMAKIVEVGQEPATKAFAILDDDPFSHAEWHNIMGIAPKVAPGEHLIVEWNELYSIGSGGSGDAFYYSLPSGTFHFRVEATTAMGVPTGVETSLAVLVPLPFWKQSWFLGVSILVAVLIPAFIVRYVIWQRMRRQMLLLEQERALEQERLRIAQDIHDDVGARVTQISLLSAMAHGNSNLSEKARTDFDQISKMSRDLISALYETVWAVSPENDNLDALGNYLCQMVDQLCQQAQLRCRLHIQILPKDVQLSSQIRHNITMAVKESVHNIVKHAQANEVVIRMTFEKELLAISIQDNGQGFQPDNQFSGNGIKNIKRRLEDIGGGCVIESQPNLGTIVRLRLSIRRSLEVAKR